MISTVKMAVKSSSAAAQFTCCTQHSLDFGATCPADVCSKRSCICVALHGLETRFVGTSLKG